ncbi:HAD family hydrolase [Nocardia asiatica]
MPRRRAAIIDMFGTLLEFERRGRSWREVLADHGIALDERVAARFVSQAADGSEHIAASRSRETYTAWEKARIAAMIRAHHVTADIGSLVEEIYAEWSTWTMKPYPEVAEVLAALRDDRVAIVVCTNWTWNVESALDQAGLTDLIDGVVVSARVGARKPHLRMFRAAVDLAGTEPDRSTVVGDSWTADILGALAAGMSAVHVDRDNTAAALPLPPRTRRVPDLRDLPTTIQLPWTC